MWNTLARNLGSMDAFVSFGSTFSPSDDLVAQLNNFVCLMYGDKTSEKVSKYRFTLLKLGKCSDDMLPPTCERLLQHIRRPNYQAAIWRQCLEAEMDIPPSGEAQPNIWSCKCKFFSVYRSYKDQFLKK